jgi:hypothetical protein
MRKHLSLAIAATMAFGAATFAADPVNNPAEKAEQNVERAADKVEKSVDRAADKADRAADRVGEKVAESAAQPLALPAGITAKDLNEQGDVRNAFEAVTEGAMSKDAFDNIVNRLVDADRDRMAKYKETDVDWKPLTSRIDALQKSWKDKYGKDFDMDEKVVFGEAGYIAIAQGEISNPQALVGNWPVKPNASAAMLASGKKPAVNTAEQQAETGKVAGGDTNLDKGRNVAIARFPAGHGLPAVDASLIHEAPDVWRFDLPDNIDGQKLTANLIAHLNQVGTKGWPDNEKDAYRIVAHRILLAMYDVQPDAAGVGDRKVE